MDTLDQKIGYLIAKAEDQEKTLVQLSVQVNTLEQRVDEKFKTAEATFRVLRVMAGLAVAILTLKFGDITKIWHAFWS